VSWDKSLLCLPHCSTIWSHLPVYLVFLWQEASSTIQELLEKLNAAKKGQKVWENKQRCHDLTNQRDFSFM
jgi:hypothetical protein